MRHVILILFLTVTIGLLAAEERSLSVLDSVDLALQNNLDLKIQDQTLDFLRWDNQWGWTQIIPSIIGSGSVIRSNVIPETSTLNPDPLQWGLRGDLTLSTPLGPSLVQKILVVFGKTLDLRKGSITYQKAIKTVVAGVYKTYFDLLFAQESQEILDNQLVVVLRQNDDLKKSYDAGFIDEFTYLQSELQKIQLEQRIISQKNRIESLENSLSLMLGQEEDTSYILSDSIPDLSKELIESFQNKTNVENNFELQTGRLNDFILEISTTATALSLLPKIELRWNTGRTFLSDISENWFNNSNWSEDTGNLVFTLSLSISNLLPGSAPFSMVEQTRRQRDSNKLFILQTERTLRRQLIDLQNSLRFNIESLNLARVQRNLARKALEIIKKQYESGLAQYTQIQEAENDQLDAEQNYLSHTVEALKNMLDINFLIGDSDDVTFYE